MNSDAFFIVSNIFSKLPSLHFFTNTFQPEDVKDSNGLKYIKKKREKTGVEYVSVLYEDAVEIWDFYGGKIPLLSNQKFNKHLKNLSKNAKIDKNVSTLTARHTYGTYLIQKGLPFDIVSKMLGHTSTKQTKTYAALLDETILRANQGIKNSGIGSTTPKTFDAPRIKKSGQNGQDWDDTLEWFRENLGMD